MSAATYLNVYNRANRKKTAVLHNAYNVTETKEINQIYHLAFEMPAADEKVQYLQPFHFVRWGEAGQMYRIVKLTESESDIGTVKVDCEHVIATLIDTVMFGNLTIGGSKKQTEDVITEILGKQTVRNWVLGGCELSGQFEYGWEQENLLNALYSVPKCFVSPYMWDFDTSVYPWKVYLKKIDSTIHPEFYIRAKQNLLQQGATQINSEICTRLYPLGYGEGINQLNITSVNDGVPYLQNDAAVDQYGVIEKVLVDRRFENASSLKAYAQTVLDGLSVPAYSRSFDVADLYPITGMEIDNAQVGKICKMTGDGTTAYITKTVRVLDDPGNLQIELSTKATDVASTIADLADRVRIESVYSQGATQLYQHSKDDNASSEKGLILNLYFPSEMRQINKVLLKVQLDKFRSYSQATDSKTVTVKSCDNPQVTVKSCDNPQVTIQSQSIELADLDTTNNDGGSGETESGGYTISGGGNTETVWDSSSGTFQTEELQADWDEETDSADGSEGDHTHYYKPYYPNLYGSLEQLDHQHAFSFDLGEHTHSFNIPDHQHGLPNLSHSHTIILNPHSHTIILNGHSHTIVLNGHSHSITPGIFEDTKNNSTAFDIYVRGVKQKTISAKSWEGDITEWLLSKGKLPRDTWIKVEIRPNNLAYVISSVFIQGFVQSRGDHTY